MMAQYPGSSGYPSPPSGTPVTGRSGAVKPRLRSIAVRIEDVTGTSWVTTSELVTDPAPRSRAAKIAGSVFKYLLGIGYIFLAAWALTWTISIVHAWWPFIPAMPYLVALKLAGVSTLFAVIGVFAKAAIRLAAGTDRLPDKSGQ